MTSPRNSTLLLHLLFSLLLAGCGFQLKGNVGTNTSLAQQQVALDSQQPRSELTVAVSQQLRLAGAEVVKADKTAVRLQLGAERFEQRNLSLTAQARAAEIELTMSVRADLWRDGQLVVERYEPSVTRQFLNDPRNVVGKVEELRLLREEMRRDLAALIVRRVGQSEGL